MRRPLGGLSGVPVRQGLCETGSDAEVLAGVVPLSQNVLHSRAGLDRWKWVAGLEPALLLHVYMRTHT